MRLPTSEVPPAGQNPIRYQGIIASAARDRAVVSPPPSPRPQNQHYAKQVSPLTLPVG